MHAFFASPQCDIRWTMVNFAAFMRLSAPPQPAAMSASETNGASLFKSVGCALCHTSSLTTGMSKFAGMSNVTYHPYSDFALHHMGPPLADGVSQDGEDLRGFSGDGSCDDVALSGHELPSCGVSQIGPVARLDFIGRAPQ